MIGVIGTGSMGAGLTRALCRAAAVQTDELVVYNRTASKAQALAEALPGICVAGDAGELIDACSHVFLCLRPKDAASFFYQRGSLFRPEQVIGSVVSLWPLAELSRATGARVFRVVPSVTMDADPPAGVVLLSFGRRMRARERMWAVQVLSALGRPVILPERSLRAASDLTSCGPGFMAHLILRWAAAAHQATGLPAAQAEALVVEMMRGLGRLLATEGMTPQAILGRVAVPGGVTRAGLEVLDQELLARLMEVFGRTARHEAEQKRALGLLGSGEYSAAGESISLLENSAHGRPLSKDLGSSP